MKRTLLALLVAWLLGIATAFGGMAVMGGWYEYRSIASFAEPDRREIAQGANVGGWQPVPGTSTVWYQRPRIRLGW